MLEGTTAYVTAAFALTGAVLLGYWLRLKAARSRAGQALSDAGHTYGAGHAPAERTRSTS